MIANEFCLLPFEYFKQAIIHPLATEIFDNWSICNFDRANDPVERINKFIYSVYPKTPSISIEFHQTGPSGYPSLVFLFPFQPITLKSERSVLKKELAVYKNANNNYFIGEINKILSKSCFDALEKEVAKQLANYPPLQDYFNIYGMVQQGAPKEAIKDYLLERGMEEDTVNKRLYFWLMDRSVIEQTKYSHVGFWKIDLPSVQSICPKISLRSIPLSASFLPTKFPSNNYFKQTEIKDEYILIVLETNDIQKYQDRDWRTMLQPSLSDFH